MAWSKRDVLELYRDYLGVFLEVCRGSTHTHTLKGQQSSQALNSGRIVGDLYKLCGGMQRSMHHSNLPSPFTDMKARTAVFAWPLRNNLLVYPMF